ncbi:MULTISPECIES: dephospho-CoA kinase [Vitreoscilla]|uniref:Dephospho-CoA kinase n=1 Tax=Vitreoscilla stercoraria TaxID=61 RepID=A0ABY4EH96_VITST|nr:MULTISPECIES: dephospho-CoA kinase [Vitreoscilla]AUZ05855.1 dephospho-CoA kinase [Vitreoscilla sp. C1]UOO92772.1 dephospho-CoA kinase [Vitreoscilla stercoraria]
MTHWVGLTGGIGSGKSTAAGFFADLGVHIIDTDVIARQLTADDGVALPHIQAVFGSEAVLDGRFNRDYMRQLIFSQPEAKVQLEAILHPLIVAEVERQKAQIQAVYAIVDVPLLTELIMFQALVERIVLIDCAPEAQIERVMQRSGLSAVQIKAIMAQQATREQRLALADDVIANDQDVLALQQRVLHQHRYYQQLFSTV